MALDGDNRNKSIDSSNSLGLSAEPAAESVEVNNKPEGFPGYENTTPLVRAERAKAGKNKERARKLKFTLRAALAIVAVFSLVYAGKDYVPGAPELIRKVGTDISNFLNENPTDEATPTVAWTPTSMPTETDMPTSTPIEDISTPISTETLEPTSEVTSTSTPEIIVTPDKAGFPEMIFDDEEAACRRGSFEGVSKAISIDGEVGYEIIIKGNDTMSIEMIEDGEMMLPVLVPQDEFDKIKCLKGGIKNANGTITFYIKANVSDDRNINGTSVIKIRANDHIHYQFKGVVAIPDSTGAQELEDNGELETFSLDNPSNIFTPITLP